MNDAVRLDLLQPGDVVLTSGKGPIAAANVLAQYEVRGKNRVWSHAAIVLEPCRWLESTGSGVAVKHVTVDKVERYGSEYRALHFWRKEYRRLSVWRHPDVRAVPGSGRYYHVNLTLQSEARRHVGYEYAELYTLLHAQRTLRNSDLLRKAAFNALDAGYKLGALRRKVAPGAFCSELVALMYLALGNALPIDGQLLKKSREPYQISPSDLADRFTKLEPKHEVLTQQRTDCPNLEAWPGRALPVAIRPEYRTAAWQEEADFIGKSLQVLVVGTAQLQQLIERVVGGDYNSQDSDDPIQPAEQTLIDTLFGSFDEIAESQAWNQATKQSQLIHRLGQYNNVGIERLRASLCGNF